MAAGWEKNISQDRVYYTLEAVGHGAEPQAVAKTLTWSEMEKFIAAACQLAGLMSSHNLRFNYRGRRYQVDVVAAQPSICFVIECKKQKRMLSGKYLMLTAEKASERARALASIISSLFPGKNLVYFIPLIVSLYEPKERLASNVLAIPVNSFPSVLRSPEQLIGWAASVQKLDSKWFSRLKLGMESGFKWTGYMLHGG